MKNILNKIRKNKKTFLIIVLFCAILALGFGVKTAWAAESGTFFGGVGKAVAILLGWIVYAFAYIIGQILTLVIKVLVDIASINNIIGVTAVSQGWAIVRDLCNMFFILILLVIAFATILRIESYSAKRLLPKLLIMAVLINFSKTIFGLVIDFAQVIMLTFVNGFGQYGANNLVNLFKIQDYLKLSNITNEKVGAMETMGAIMAGFFAIVITFIVVVVLLAVLVMRLIMLWVYTILSPFVFLGAAFPPMQKYTSRIWEDFVKNVVVGPVLAFFIWLALATASNSAAALQSVNQGNVSVAGVNVDFCAGASTLFCSGAFTTYIITIALLIGGLMVTQQIGGIAGSIAGKGMQWAKRAPMLAGKGALGVAAWGARKIKSSEGRLGGLELNPMNIYRGIKEGFVEKKRKEISDSEAKSADALKKGGIGGLIKGLGASKDMTEAMARGWFGNKGIQMAWQTARAPKRRKEFGEIEDEKKPIEEEIMAYKEKMTPHKEAINLHEANKAELVKLQDKNNNGTASGIEKLRITELQIKIKGEAGNIKNHEKEIEINKKEIEDREAKINDINIRAKKYKEEKPIRTPFTFEANMGRKKSVRDAMAKIGDNDNAEDLVDMWRHAKAVGDKEMAAAVFLAAAKNGHSNEIIQAEKGKEGGKFAGKTYETNQDGLNAFVNEQLRGGLGMAEQEAFDYQSQFSSICKQVGHFMFAESIGSKNGMLTQKTDKDQERDARIEGRKVDSERYTRDRNRFGYGYENENREFRFNRLGLTTVVENAGIIDKEIARSRFNKNAAMKMLDDMETLEKYLKEAGQTTYMDIDKDGKKIEKSWADLIIKMKEYGKAAKDSGGSEFGSAADKVLKK